MTFALSFLGCVTAILVMIAVVWTYLRHVAFPRLLKYLVENRAELEAAIRSGGAAEEGSYQEAAATTRDLPSELEGDDDQLGMSYEDIADIMLTMTHAQRVTVLLLMQSGERDQVLNACIRAHDDARNVARVDFKPTDVLDEAS